MKYLLLSTVLIASLFLTSCDTQQVIQAANDIISSNTQPNDAEMKFGVKQALEFGIKNAVNRTSTSGGFLNNNAIKILFPPEVKKVENTLRDLGAGSLVDNAISKLNAAAEDASQAAVPIFVDAIKQLTFSDIVSILKGDKNACTQYLQRTTRSQLYNMFKPSINNSINKVGLSNVWNQTITKYNQIPLVQKVNPDLNDYVTNKALDGLFYEVAKEELKIRENPVARTTDILKKVFGWASK
jgi:hypothetical protein